MNIARCRSTGAQTAGASDAASDAVSGTIDYMPTFANLVGFKMTSDRLIGGVNQTEWPLGESDKGGSNEQGNGRVEDVEMLCQATVLGSRGVRAPKGRSTSSEFS